MVLNLPRCCSRILSDPSTKEAPIHFSLTQNCPSNWLAVYSDCGYDPVVGQFTGLDGLVYLWRPVRHGFECVRNQLTTSGTSEVRVAHFRFPSFFALTHLGELNILEQVVDQAMISVLLATSWIMDRDFVRKGHVAWGITAATTLALVLAELASNRQYSSSGYYLPDMSSTSRLGTWSRSSRNRSPSNGRVSSALSQPGPSSAPSAASSNHRPRSAAPNVTPISTQPSTPRTHRVLVVNPDNSMVISEPLTQRLGGMTAVPHIKANEIPWMP